MEQFIYALILHIQDTFYREQPLFGDSTQEKYLLSSVFVRHYHRLRCDIAHHHVIVRHRSSSLTVYPPSSQRTLAHIVYYRFDIIPRFLEYHRYLVNEGVQGLTAWVQEGVKAELYSKWPLTKNVTFDDMLRIIWQIRLNIEGKFDLQGFVLPPEGAFSSDVCYLQCAIEVINLQ